MGEVDLDFYTAEARAGVLFIRGLADEAVLAGARWQASPAFGLIGAEMALGTDPSWIVARCAEVALGRGLIQEQELFLILR